MLVEEKGKVQDAAPENENGYILTENRNEPEILFFAAVFRVPPARNLHFTPVLSQKGAWTALKPPPTKKTKNDKNKNPKTIPHPFRIRKSFLW